MGIIEKLTSGDPKRRSRSDKDYVDLGDASIGESNTAADTQIHFAEVRNQQDTIKAQDALYDGDVVILDLKYVDSAGLNAEYIIDQLQKTVEEIGGDIAQRGEDKIVVTPNGVSISRTKL